MTGLNTIGQWMRLRQQIVRRARRNEDFGDVATSRRVILAGTSLPLEDSVRAVEDPIASGYSSQQQMVVPYFSAFHWRVVGSDCLINLNTLLFVAGSREFSESHPSARVGHGSVVLTPSPALPDEISWCRSIRPSGIVDGLRPLTPAMRLDAHRLLSGSLTEPLALVEVAIRLVAAALRSERPRRNPSTLRMVESAKHLLFAHGRRPISLGDSAQEVGVSPVYLTQTFTGVTGMPLCRYHRQLRLAQALFELRDCANLTELALELGFSSYAHFTNAFRAAFGMAPSRLRMESQCSTAPSVGGAWPGHG